MNGSSKTIKVAYIFMQNSIESNKEIFPLTKLKSKDQIIISVVIVSRNKKK